MAKDGRSITMAIGTMVVNVTDNNLLLNIKEMMVVNFIGPTELMNHTTHAV